MLLGRLLQRIKKNIAIEIKEFRRWLGLFRETKKPEPRHASINVKVDVSAVNESLRQLQQSLQGMGESMRPAAQRMAEAYRAMGLTVGGALSRSLSDTIKEVAERDARVHDKLLRLELACIEHTFRPEALSLEQDVIDAISTAHVNNLERVFGKARQSLDVRCIPPVEDVVIDFAQPPEYVPESVRVIRFRGDE